MSTPRPGLVGAELCRQVAQSLRRRASGLEERVEKLAHPLPVPHTEHGLHSVALLIDRGGMGRHRAGRLAADVGMVRPIRHPRHQLGVVEHRPHEREVVEMSPTRERIVDGVLRPGLHARPEHIEHRSYRRRHRTEVHRNVLGLSQHLPGRDEHGRRAVGPLLDVRRVGSAAKHDTHLIGNLRKTVAGDLERDGVDLHHSTTRAPPSWTTARSPSPRKVVASGSSTTAGPTTSAPGAKPGRHHTAASRC